MDFVVADINDLEEIYKMGSLVKEFQTDKGNVGFWSKETLKNVLESKDDIVVKCLLDNALIGFIIVSFSATFSKAIIENIYVKEEYRNRGIGRRLISKATEILKEKHCKFLIALTKNSVEEFLYWGFVKGEKFNWMSIDLDQKE